MFIFPYLEKKIKTNFLVINNKKNWIFYSGFWYANFDLYRNKLITNTR